MYKPEFYIEDESVRLRNEYPSTPYPDRIALVWGIMVWKLIANNIIHVKNVVGSSVDPVCNKYDGVSDCPNCPIAKHYGRKSCSASPEHIFVSAANNEDYGKAKMAADKMIEMLRTVLGDVSGEVLFAVWR